MNLFLACSFAGMLSSPQPSFGIQLVKDKTLRHGIIYTDVNRKGGAEEANVLIRNWIDGSAKFMLLRHILAYIII